VPLRIAQRLGEMRVRLEPPTEPYRRIAKRPLAFARRIGQHDISGLSAELAYRFFLALFPFVIFLAALGAFIARGLGLADPSGEILRAFGAALPAEVAALMGEELRTIMERTDAGLLTFGALAALYVATGGTNAALKGVQRAYGLNVTRPIWRAYPLGIALTLGGGTLIVVLFVLLVGLEVAGATAAGRSGVEPAWPALMAVRWAIAIPVLVLVSGTLYRIGTVLRPPLRAVLPGAGLFALAWLAVTYLFALYVDTLGTYGATYGALAGVAGLLVWLYLSAFVLLLGAELTGSLFDRSAAADTPSAPRQP